MDKAVNFFDAKYLLIFFLLVGGIAIRFYMQFIEWSFNGDELDLGLGIISSDFRQLISPLPKRQSAPPLFLIVQKLIAPVAKPYVSLKILSFITSGVSILLFNRVLKSRFPFYLHIVLLALFCLNPFIITNSLTLKQYSLDLFLGLVAVNYFIGDKNAFSTFGFFSIFCLFSNVGPFFCVSFAIYKILKEFTKKGFFSFKVIKEAIPFLLAPIPYLLFFIWFMQQPGAENIKTYMTGYWSEAFMPTDLSILPWIALQAKVIMIFFFSTYWVTGLVLLLVFLAGLYTTFEKRQQTFKRELLSIILIYITAGFIHILFSGLKMYPFSDRLLLYLAPGIYLILGFGILELIEYLKKWKFWKMGKYVLFLLICGNIFLFFTYFPKKTNDVVALKKFINSVDGQVAFTSRAEQLCSNWIEFTQYHNSDPSQTKNVVRSDVDVFSETNFLIAVQNIKFGHKGKLTTPEPIVNELLAQDKILLYDRLGGFAIYKVKD